MKHVVMFSGGAGSWATAKRVAEQHGTDDMVLLFSDVKGGNPSPHVGEDEDTYRFIREAADNVGAELVTVADGRDIWQVFRDERYLGNSRKAKCSQVLKQKPARRWLKANTDPADTVVYVGIGWDETHRLAAIVRNYVPWRAEAPMTEPPYLDREAVLTWMEGEGLRPPRLYDLGWSHNNCGGGCVKAGQGQFKKLLEVMPERYAEWERQENELRAYLDKDVSILREQVKGERRNLPLTVLRKRIEAGADVDDDDLGGCGCFVDYEGETA